MLSDPVEPPLPDLPPPVPQVGEGPAPPAVDGKQAPTGIRQEIGNVLQQIGGMVGGKLGGALAGGGKAIGAETAKEGARGVAEGVGLGKYGEVIGSVAGAINGENTWGEAWTKTVETAGTIAETALGGFLTEVILGALGVGAGGVIGFIIIAAVGAVVGWVIDWFVELITGEAEGKSSQETAKEGSGDNSGDQGSGTDDKDKGDEDKEDKEDKDKDKDSPEDPTDGGGDGGGDSSGYGDSGSEKPNVKGKPNHLIEIEPPKSEAAKSHLVQSFMSGQAQGVFLQAKGLTGNPEDVMGQVSQPGNDGEDAPPPGQKPGEKKGPPKPGDSKDPPPSGPAMQQGEGEGWELLNHPKALDPAKTADPKKVGNTLGGKGLSK